MQKMLKRVIAIIMVLIFCMSAGVLNVLAEELTKPTLKVENVSAMPGSTIKVKIDLKNNPGLASLKFDVSYDDVLTLTNVEFNSEYGSYVTAPTPYKNPQTISMISPLADVSVSGNFCTLTFTVSENVEDNYSAAVNVSYDTDDVFNSAYESVDLNVVCGGVKVYHGIPGDINGDKKVNNRDAILLFQYVAGWDVEVDLNAVDCNGDDKVNTKDAIDLFRYCAGWEGITIVRGRPCVHNLVATQRKEATCEEDGNIAYWHCTLCGKTYSNENATTIISMDDTVIPAKGHTVVIDPAVPATDTSTGLTEGSHCSVCEKILVKQEVTPIIVPEQYAITYNIANGDEYIATQKVYNSNPDYYTSKGLQLEDISVPGYHFDGWYDGASNNANKVTEIPANRTGKIQLYAHWTTLSYTVTFISPLVPVANRQYSVNTGLALEELTLGGYNFMGWSKNETYILSQVKCENPIREKQVLVKNIPVGTVGDITLYANWSSKRNQTIPVEELGDPYIIEDSDNGQIVFAYEIGTVENVPLYQIGKTFQSVNGLVQTVSETVTESISEAQATTIANTVSKATTSSASWSLSNSWDKTTTVDESRKTQQEQKYEEIDALSRTHSGTYSLNSSVGGASSFVNSQGLSASFSRERSGSTTTTKETGSNSKFNIGAKIGRDVTAKIPLGILELGAKNSFDISGGYEYSKYKKNTTSKTDSWKDTVSGSYNASSTSTVSKTWNSSEGYSVSDSVSQNKTVSKAISEVITKEKHYGESYSAGGSNSESQAFENSNTNTEQYSDAITYNKSATTTTTTSITMNGEKEGYYRVVCAGKMHVFAIVTYDVATSAYSVSTYSVMDDKTTEFIDYSRSTQSFNDNENGVLPFEIPSFVDEYVDTKIAKTNGLQIDIETGEITGYGSNDPNEITDPIVIIPSYIRVKIDENTYRSVKVKGFKSNVFSNNKNIVAVCLNSFIKEIPDNAFSGCTSLKEVICPSVVSIGDNAFAGCTSLSTYSVSDGVISLGNNAFENVPEIQVSASNKAVATAAAASGAKRITIDISNVKNSNYIENEEEIITEDEDINGTEITVPVGTEYLEIQGEEKEYSNLKINSDAQTTVLSGLTITNSGTVPLVTSSSNVTFNRVQIEATGFVWLQKEAANVSLFGNNKITSGYGTAVVCKDIDFNIINPEVASTLAVSGKMYIWGEKPNSAYLLIPESDVKEIDEAEFNRLIQGSFNITFDANGGTVSETSKTCYYGSAIGELPVPTKENYRFYGWYTEKDAGTMVTADTVMPRCENYVLYAHWTEDTYTLTFDPNGGSISELSKTSIRDKAVGDLPIPTRQYYTFDGWYTDRAGGEKVTASSVFGNDTTIYAHWNANEYTYNIVYKSSNGTSLGSSSVTKAFGSTATISAPQKSGYNKPDSREIVWDSSTKTITFTYSPTSVPTSQAYKSGTWHAGAHLTYSSTIEYRNRTATSIQVRLHWTNTIAPGTYYYGFGQKVHIAYKSGSDSYYNTGVTIAEPATFANSSSKKRSASVYTNWLTVPVTATQTSVVIYANYWSSNYKNGGANEYISKSVTIPAY